MAMRRHISLLIFLGLLLLGNVAQAADTPQTWDEMRAGEVEQDGEQRLTLARKLAHLAEPQLQMMQNQTNQVLNVAEPYLKPFYAANPGREDEIRNIYAKNMHESLGKYFGVFRGLLPKVLASSYTSDELARLTAYYQEPLVQKEMAVLKQSQNRTSDIAKACFKENGLPTSSGKMMAMGRCGQQGIQPIIQQGMGSDYTALQQLNDDKYADLLSEKSLSRATQKIYKLATTPEMALYLLKLMRESQVNLQQDFLAAGVTIPQQAPAAPAQQAPGSPNDPLNPQSYH